jgi:hypothetical protein
MFLPFRFRNVNRSSWPNDLANTSQDKWQKDAILSFKAEEPGNDEKVWSIKTRDGM